MRTNQWVSRAAGAGALTLILAMPAVAQTNGGWQQRNGNNGGRNRTQTTAPVQSRDRNSGRNNNGNVATQAIQTTQAAPQIQTRSNNSNRGGNWGQAQQSQIQTRGANNGGYTNTTNRNVNRSAQVTSSSYRDNQRVALSGRISSFSRESNGYRVRLDRGQSFFVPEAYYRGHISNFGLGLSINLGGIFRGGDIYLDAGGYPVNVGYGGYDNGFIRGVVDRVDYRTGIAWLRDDTSGRLITADMRSASQNGQDLRPGDFVELSGQWVRGNVFAVTQIDNVQGGRY
jgi:hypothetical protein